MKKNRKAEKIARKADGNKTAATIEEGPAAKPIQRVNLDLTAAMLEELDQAARELNISRQAVIKTLVRQALDQHYLARSAAQRR
jgi:hypothetical protein